MSSNGFEVTPQIIVDNEPVEFKPKTLKVIMKTEKEYNFVMKLLEVVIVKAQTDSDFLHNEFIFLRNIRDLLDE